MRFLDGRPVNSRDDWQARRAEIRELYERYQLGTFPPKPKLDRAVVLEETAGDGYLTRDVRLEFGPGGKGAMRVRVVIPDGAGPFPVLISSDLDGWSRALIRRGYISCGYAGNDRMDDAAPLADLYPDNDFAVLPRRAWAAGLVVDYLETLTQVDMQRVGIYGYSRNGKMAAIAAAIDERISAVIAGSTGVGGVLPWRLSGERNAGESIESTTRSFPTWFHPRLRFFSGREDRLPIDANLLMAMIAPRSLLIQYGLNDEVANTWGNEYAYYSAQEVYEFLGAPDKMGILRVPGFHGSNDQERALDWLDIQFGRSDRAWYNDFLFPWDWEEWRQSTSQAVDVSAFARQNGADILSRTVGGHISSTAGWEQRASEIRESISWMLGERPPMIPPVSFGGRSGGRGQNPGQTSPDVPRWVIWRGGTAFGWLEPQRGQTESRPIRFGYNVTGDLYYPAGSREDAHLPTVVWLHGYSYPLGYMWVYRNDLHPILALVEAGYAVLAYDQSGFGSRMDESGPFYERYPEWSRMGRLVEDVSTAIDALQNDSMVNPDRIYVFGYSLGGMVGLYSAAMDVRIKGVVSISGLPPMRTDTADRGTGGIARYSHERGLLPKLGFFIGEEQRIPYDLPEILGAIAPRPVMLLQPQLDRDGHPEDVRAAVEEARRVYSLFGAVDSLTLREPWDYTRLPTETQNWIISTWMTENFR
jgi:pimeloyl-ACP methyl ester carboxylesterase